MPEYVKSMGNRNNVTCGCETCISAMLLQSDLNKWRSTKLAKIDQLYINESSTKLLKRSNKYCIEYKNHIFPNDKHIHLIAYDHAS